MHQMSCIVKGACAIRLPSHSYIRMVVMALYEYIYVYMYIPIYIYTYIYIYMHTFIYMYICIHGVCVCIHGVCMYIWCVCMYIYQNAQYTHEYARVCVCTYMSAYLLCRAACGCSWWERQKACLLCAHEYGMHCKTLQHTVEVCCSVLQRVVMWLVLR